MRRRRVPSTYDRTGWVVIPNPAYSGEPRPMRAECHDGTPFLTLQGCVCGGVMHIHESSIIGAPADAEIGASCPHCGRMLVFPLAMIRGAFAQMRADGWIAP